MNFYVLNGQFFEKVAFKAEIENLESSSWSLPHLTDQETNNPTSVAVEILITIVTCTRLFIIFLRLAMFFSATRKSCTWIC